MARCRHRPNEAVDGAESAGKVVQESRRQDCIKVSSGFTHIDPDQTSANVVSLVVQARSMLRPAMRRHCCSTCARVMQRCGTCGRRKLILSIGRMTWKPIVPSSESHQKQRDATGCLELGTGIDEHLRRRRGRQSLREDIYPARTPSLPVSPSSTQHNDTFYCLITQQNTPHSIHETGLKAFTFRHRSTKTTTTRTHTSTATQNNRNHVIGHAIHRQGVRCSGRRPGPRSAIRSLTATAHPPGSCTTRPISRPE
jgi:hypothetical protein